MDDHVPPGSDPGWGLDWRVLLIFLPVLGRRSLRHLEGGLGTIRRVFLSFVGALVLIGVVVLLIWSGDGSGPTDPIDATLTAVGVFALGLGGVVASWRIQRELPCDDVGLLVGTYRTRFFLRIAFAEMSALLGFVGFFLSGNPVAYFVGLVPTLIGFAALAPTRANLEREDESMRLRGCRHTIYRTLLDLA